MRTFHRILSIIACLVLLYLGVTGSWMQTLDLNETLRGAPESAEGMLSINEGKNGNFDYAVVTLGDYSAKALPTDLDIRQAFGTVLKGLHEIVPDSHPTFVELRMAGDRPIGQARFGQLPHNPRQMGDGISAVDTLSGAAVEPLEIRPVFPRSSMRQTLKEWHRFWERRDIPGVYAELLAGIAMWVLIVTGLVMYFRLLKQRRKMKSPGFFWMTGDLWRSLHRVLAVAASVLLIVVAFSGTWLGFESVWHTFVHRPRDGHIVELTDADVMRMVDATLVATRTMAPDVPIKVLRVRDYAGMKQGIVVTDEPVTRQLVFDTATGRSASLTEPNYPVSGFPFGLETHEFMKHLHSGFLFGTWARLLDLLAGLSLIFLSASGLWMYIQMYKRRRDGGRAGFFWT